MQKIAKEKLQVQAKSGNLKIQFRSFMEKFWVGMQFIHWCTSLVENVDIFQNIECISFEGSKHLNSISFDITMHIWRAQLTDNNSNQNLA